MGWPMRNALGNQLQRNLMDQPLQVAQRHKERLAGSKRTAILKKRPTSHLWGMSRVQPL